jgi:sugar lactone lactonase YvrE/catechol 2,3-dioxygenase-like lactoylglutathione lyase family enzyme
MNRLATILLAAAVTFAVSATPQAQLLDSDARVRVGHYHLNVSSVEEHRKFWIETLGGVPAKVGNTEAVRFGDVFLFLRPQKPSGPTRGTTFDHIGFAVPNVPEFTKSVVAKGYQLTVGREIPGQAAPAQGASAVYGQFMYLLGPDGVKVEIVTNKTPNPPAIVHHHVHFVNPQYVEMGRWLMNALDATERPGTTDFFFGADLPGIGYMLNFFRWEMKEPLVGTTGRAIDHVGFEVRDLAEFVKRLDGKGIKLAVPVRKDPALGNVSTATITDPWGTVIELTEGLTAAAQPQGSVRNDLPQPYVTRRDWGGLPPGVKWAAVTAVEPSPDGSIYVVHRCFANSCAGRSEAPILKYSTEGRLLASWGQGMFVFPHGGTVDRQGNFWITDARGDGKLGHQVFKFSPDGKLLMTLGKAGVSGSGPDLFDQPTDVVVAANGDIFVTDSHRGNAKNNRVVKFNRDGKYIREWGKKGSGPGEFSEPHTIAMDSRGRLFVGDRENNRIQIFDQDGNYVAEWRQFGRPSGISITADDTIYVADSESGPDTGANELPGIRKGIRIGSARDGAVTAFIEDMESTAPDHSGAEGVGVDAKGNVYGAVVRRQMLERHERRN